MQTYVRNDNIKTEHTFERGVKMRIAENMSLMDKLNILSDAAKYDVACTSSGTDRKNDGTGMGNCVKAGICHSFSADVFRCLKFYLPMSAFLTVNIALTVHPMMFQEHLSHRRKCVN